MIHPDDPAQSYPEFLNGAVLLRTDLPPGGDPGRRCIASRRGSGATAAGDRALAAPADRSRPDRARRPGRATIEALRLPHPEMHKRDFVLAPFCEVWPDWRHPVLGRTAAELLAGAAQPLRRRPPRAGSASRIRCGGVQELRRHPHLVGADQRRPFLRRHQAGQLRERVALGHRARRTSPCARCRPRPGTAPAAPPARRSAPAAPSYGRAPGSGTCPSPGRARAGPPSIPAASAASTRADSQSATSRTTSR